MIELKNTVTSVLRADPVCRLLSLHALVKQAADGRGTRGKEMRETSGPQPARN